LIAFVLRRLVLALVVLVAVSFGSFWFFARNFYVLPGTMLPESPVRAWWHWFTGIPHGSFARGALGEDLWPRLGPASGHTAALLAFTFVLLAIDAALDPRARRRR
jgi:hypothetical protein